jgi:hypothetical protein
MIHIESPASCAFNGNSFFIMSPYSLKAISSAIFIGPTQVRYGGKSVVVPGRLEIGAVFEAFPEGFGLLIIRLKIRHVDIRAALSQFA